MEHLLTVSAPGMCK